MNSHAGYLSLRKPFWFGTQPWLMIPRLRSVYSAVQNHIRCSTFKVQGSKFKVRCWLFFTLCVLCVLCGRGMCIDTLFFKHWVRWFCARTVRSCASSAWGYDSSRFNQYEKAVLSQTQTSHPHLQWRPAIVRQPEMLARAAENGSCPRPRLESRRLDGDAGASVRQANAARVH